MRSPASATTVAVGNAATSRQNGRCQQTRLPWKIAHHSMKSGRRNGGAARADDQLGTPTNDDRRVVGRAGLPCDVIDHPGSVSWNRSTGRQTRTSYHRSGLSSLSCWPTRPTRASRSSRWLARLCPNPVPAKAQCCARSTIWRRTAASADNPEAAPLRVDPPMDRRHLLVRRTGRPVAVAAGATWLEQGCPARQQHRRTRESAARPARHLRSAVRDNTSTGERILVC